MRNDWEGEGRAEADSADSAAMLPLIALPVASTGSKATKQKKDRELANLLAAIRADRHNGEFEAMKKKLKKLESMDLNLSQRISVRGELAEMDVECRGWGTLGPCKVDNSK